ncbi:MAG: hypothetical protein HRT77_17465, partial [Halioglobus sp.]|nr:hypothetical protein [Halioglobus sp.]
MMIRCLTTVLLAAGLALAGCKSNSTVDLDKPLGPFEPETPNEAARLRTQLVGFADYFSARVAATADEIAFSTHSRELQEMTLRWKLRVIPAMQAAVLVPDPRAALLDTWVLCAQNEEYLSGKQGALEFGEYQELALRTVRELKQEITNIAEGLLTPEAHAAVSEDIQALVAGSPIRGRFAIDLIRASEEIAANRDRGITELLSLPLGGVRESAEAIDRVARVTEVLTEVLEDLPERTRWQTELLLLEMERLE